ncbi:MAG: hypothetical protein Fur0016_07000 [Anaerolineales bacterium]
MPHAQKMLTYNVQMVTKEQIIILMDTARERIFDGNQRGLRPATCYRFKDRIKTLARFRLDGAKILKNGLLTISPRFTLKSDSHLSPLPFLPN